MSDDSAKSAADSAAADLYQIPNETELLQACLDQSIEALSFSGFVSDDEKDGIRQRYLAEVAPGQRRPDVIECLVRVRHGEDASLNDMTEDLSYVASLYLAPSPILVPFTPSLPPPTNFYEKEPEIEKLARTLLTPVTYAEDADVLGICSLNAVAAEVAADEIRQLIKSKIGTEPYITVTRIDYRGWINLLNSHFNL